MLEGLSIRYPEKTSYLGQVFNDTSNSYKFVWFLGILSLLRRGSNGELPLADLMTGMAVTARHPVCFFRLSLGRQDKLQESIIQIRTHSLLRLGAAAQNTQQMVVLVDPTTNSCCTDEQPRYARA